jgi:hypothetical protein
MRYNIPNFFKELAVNPKIGTCGISTLLLIGCYVLGAQFPRMSPSLRLITTVSLRQKG